MAFPALVPTSRTLTPGSLPIRTYRTLNGAIWKRSFSNTRSGHSISLEFRNITDAEADQFMAHYEEMGGSFYRFTLPQAVFTGISSTTLVNRMKAPTSVKWAYASEPKVSSVFPGRSVVSVELIGEVQYP